MNQKEIAFITPQLYPDFVGGAEVFNYYLIKELSAEHDVSYITGIDATILGAKKIKLRFKRNFVQQIELILRIAVLSKRKLLVHSFMKTKWYYIIIYPLFKIFLNKRYSVIIHGGGMMAWKWKWPYKLYFKNAKDVFGVSEKICEEYYRRTNINIKYLPPLIPFKKSLSTKVELRDKHKLPRDAKIFLIVGSLKNLKRPMIVLEAFNKLGQNVLNDHNVKIIFAGDGPLKAEMEEYIKNNFLVNHVKLMGNVPRESINEFYESSDYYILSSDFEGTPISMLEAMFNKLLIFGSDVPGINNIIEASDGGYLFNNTKVSSLSELISKVLHSNDLTKQENAYMFYNNNFNYSKVIKKFTANI